MKLIEFLNYQPIADGLRMLHIIMLAVTIPLIVQTIKDFKENL